MTLGTPIFGAAFGGSAGSLDLTAMTDVTAPVSPIVPLASASGFQIECMFQGTSGATEFLYNISSGTFGPTTGLIIATAATDGQPHHLAVKVVQNGANADFTTYKDGVLGSTTSFAGTLSNSVQILVRGSAGSETVFAHLAIYDFASIDPPTTRAPAATGYAGELAHTRFSRLCTEESIPADVDPQSTELMGAQGVKTLLELLRECEAADEGLMHDQVDGRLAFTPRVVRENRTVALTLDYASRQVSPPLEPTDDDQRIRNDITVTRTGGAKANAVDTTGPVGVTAVGRYDEAVELNLFTDDQAERHAGWRLNLGTVDGLRFPTVTVNLRRNNSLTASIVAITDIIGSRIKITNLPDVVSFDDVDLIIEGYTEQISQKNWIITFNCAPYAPYLVAIVEDPAAATDTPRIGSGTAVLASNINTTDTSLSVTTGAGGLWTTAGADFSMDINIEGERIRLSAISGSSSPQTFTASARSVNGVVKSHLAGARIEPWQTATIGMA